MPWAPAQLRGGFEQRELVGPGGEAAVAPVRVEFRQDRDECVVCRLHGEIFDAVWARDGDWRPAPADFQAGRAQGSACRRLMASSRSRPVPDGRRIHASDSMSSAWPADPVASQGVVMLLVRWCVWRVGRARAGLVGGR